MSKVSLPKKKRNVKSFKVSSFKKKKVLKVSKKL